MPLERRISSYKEVLRAAWENKDRGSYALRILRNGVCDGCSLGTHGMRDWTQNGIHLCWVRLNLLRLNTIPPFDPSILTDASKFADKPEKELRRLGRLPSPMIRRKGEGGFSRIEWDEALSLIAERIRKSEPRRLAFYAVSRGTANETYYVFQKVARFLGSNNIDNSARICHAASTTGLKQTVGYAATLCSLKDLIGTDLVIFFGSNVANNQPVLMKYLHLARKAGTKIAVVNPYKEPGMQRYWVPSNWDSELFGTKVADSFFQTRPGGDIPFINGVLKHLIANSWTDEDFIRKSTTGWDSLIESLRAQPFDELEKYSGVSREQMLEFARSYAGAKKAVIVWSMGVTQYSYGTQNVKAIANLGLARGMVGRPKTGLMPLRGHSGVQGGAEVGATPTFVTEHNAPMFRRLWGFDVPTWKGYFVSEMIDAAYNGEVDVLYCIGSNLLAVLPDREYSMEALERIPLRVHNDIVLNPQMFVEPNDIVLLLPATTRYEMAGGNTETSTERRIIFNPEIPGPRVLQARDEWRVLIEVAKRVKPDLEDRIDFKSTTEIREDIARAVPYYDGIQRLKVKGDQVQWGGERLCENGKFNTPDGKGHFTPSTSLQKEVPEGWFTLITRRGKQFNSMVFGDKDVLSEARRCEIIVSGTDMRRLNLQEGTEVMVKSTTGAMKAVVKAGPVFEGSVMMNWPEANVLIKRSTLDPECGVPAYRDELVQLIAQGSNPTRRSVPLVGIQARG